MITMTSITVKGDQEEELRGMSRDFPYLAVYGDINRYVGGFVPWHWHEAIEIIHVLSGSVSVLVGDVRHSLRGGEVFFINSNKLHSIRPEPGCEHVFFHTFLFEPALLAGQYGSAFERKYVTPLISDGGVSGLAFRAGEERNGDLEVLLRSVFSESRDESYGFEMRVRSLLSDVWLIVLETTGRRAFSSARPIDARADRIKAMILYIRKHYRNKIRLADIAESANISERECLRCFALTIGMTPFDYLAQYRIGVAAELLASGNLKIIDVGEAAGFSSASYFGKIFRETMGCSPREYRLRRGGTG